MLEIRYRFTVPGHRLALDSWFDEADGDVVHALDVAFEGDRGSARFIGVPDGDGGGLAERLATPPFPTMTTWEPEGSAEALAYRAEWLEPILPGVRSPMKVAHDALGPEARSSFTAMKGTVVHRIILPRGVPHEPLWPMLKRELDVYARVTGRPGRIDLERVGAWVPEGRLKSDDAHMVLLAAYMLGYYDTPPLATVEDVARVLGLPGDLVLAHLKDLERDALGGSPLDAQRSTWRRATDASSDDEALGP